MAAVMHQQLVCQVAPVEAIVRLASKVPVFPCRRVAEELNYRGKAKLYKPKTPLTARGLHDATQDPDQIRAWWSRWPDALVGVPTGSATRIFVLDFDSHKADQSARDWIGENTELLLGTRSHETLNGGRHYLYRIQEGAQYRSGVNIFLGGQQRTGLDVRADGGYIVWWPMHGAGATGEIAALPAGLVDQFRIDKRELAPLPTKSPEAWARDVRPVTDALAYIDPTDHDRWFRIGMAIHLASGGSEQGFQLWHAWSCGGLTGDCPHNYSGEADCRYRWDSFRHDKKREGTVTLGSLFTLAKAGGYKSDREVQAASVGADIEYNLIDPLPPLEPPAAAPPAPSITPPERRPLDWETLEGRTPPLREWAMEYWLPMGHTALCAGRGGLGKTLAMQTMASCIALGRPYVDEVFEPRRVLFWAGEDEDDELWRRQIAICKWLGVSLAELKGKFYLESYYARDITLAGLAYGGLTKTTMLAELEQQIGDYKADFVILDSTARVFGGNENDRHQVTTFVSWLANACKVTGAGLCLIGHPGKAEGSEYSGSTAWEGSVRSRLYLSTKLPQGGGDDEEAEEGAGDSVRYLSRRKANYASQDWRRLNYQDGVLVPDAAPARRFGAAGAQFGQEVVLRAMQALKAMNLHGTASTRSPDYLPRLAQQYGLLEGLSPKAFGARMRELMVSQRIKSEAVGFYSNRTPKHGLVQA